MPYFAATSHFSITQQSKYRVSNKTARQNHSASQAAYINYYRTAVLCACASQSIATIGPHSLPHVKKYTHPLCNHLAILTHPCSLHINSTPLRKTSVAPLNRLPKTKVPESMPVHSTSSLPLQVIHPNHQRWPTIYDWSHIPWQITRRY